MQGELFPDNRGVDYYKELAHLRGELVGCLMSGNHSYGAVVAAQLKDLEEKGTFDLGRAPTVDQKSDLRDALARLTVAVNHIIEG